MFSKLFMQLIKCKLSFLYFFFYTFWLYKIYFFLFYHYFKFRHLSFLLKASAHRLQFLALLLSMIRYSFTVDFTRSSHLSIRDSRFEIRDSRCHNGGTFFFVVSIRSARCKNISEIIELHFFMRYIPWFFYMFLIY